MFYLLNVLNCFCKLVFMKIVWGWIKQHYYVLDVLDYKSVMRFRNSNPVLVNIHTAALGQTACVDF